MNDTPSPADVDQSYVWSGQHCGDCDHCRPGPLTQSDVLQRVCYRHPPTVALAAGPDGQPAAITFRPSVRVDTPACGDFDEKYEAPAKVARAC